MWTGDAGGKCTEIKETGIIGSMRWWYEAIVRGLGGYACDPTKPHKCELSGKEKKTERVQKLCPVCYLFGTTGWKRQFNLQVKPPRQVVPLHFRTGIPMNYKWLGRIFGGAEKEVDGRKEYDISNLKVFFGNLEFHAVFREVESNFARMQFSSLLNFMSKYGGIGAKLQHGFGQFGCEPSSDFGIAFSNLYRMIEEEQFKTDINPNEAPNLKNFVCTTYNLKQNDLKGFLGDGSHYGSQEMKKEGRYIPCVFDLRYKGKANIGFRQWLEERKSWSHDNLNRLLGVSEKKGQEIKDGERAASKVMMGMPYKQDNGYSLKVFAFSPSDLLSPAEFVDLFDDYMQEAFGVNGSPVYGTDILKKIKEGTL
ncbi:MAG TPA: type III-B CRISPR module RAMP protein Cmr1 [Archaeoglobus sp.]|nr:type III-B CRISPR module RAMP protein Cmr1 [Archaeoglobus sp.]